MFSLCFCLFVDSVNASTGRNLVVGGVFVSAASSLGALYCYNEIKKIKRQLAQLDNQEETSKNITIKLGLQRRLDFFWKLFYIAVGAITVGMGVVVSGGQKLSKKRDEEKEKSGSRKTSRTKGKSRRRGGYDNRKIRTQEDFLKLYEEYYGNSWDDETQIVEC